MMEVLRKCTIFANRTMDEFHFQGLGCPRSERVVRFVAALFLWLLRVYLKSHQLPFLNENIGLQHIVCKVHFLWIENMSSEWISYQVGNLQSSYIICFPFEVKAFHVVLHPLRCYLIGAFLQKLLIITEKILVFTLTSIHYSSFYSYLILK